VNGSERRSGLLSPAHRLMIAAFVMDLAIAMIGIAVQFMGNALDARPMILGLLGTASPAAYTLGCLVTGRLSDKFGRRLLNSASCLICAGAWLAMTQVKTPIQLLALVPISGAAISMFWPPLQAWLSEVTVGGRRQLIRNIGNFNISWTVGLMLGPPIAGLAWDLSRAAPFAIAAVGALGLLVMLQTIPSEVEGGGEAVPEDALADRPCPEVSQHYLHLAWVANFASWFGRGMNIVVFPKLGTMMELPERYIGVVIATFLAGQLLMFAYLRERTGWQYRLWPLLAALGAGAVGWVIAWFARDPLTFVLAFALGGMGAGVTYVSSLYYSLEGRTVSRGARTGIHEAVLGSGVFLGPLSAGAIAGYAGFRAPYIVTAGVFVLVAAIVWGMWRRMPKDVAEAEEECSAEVPVEVSGE